VGGVGRWNKRIEKTGVAFRFRLPHKAFNRRIGTLSSLRISPTGEVIDEARWNANVESWLPSESDRAFLASLMGRVVEPGKFAGWIAPPATGIDRRPLDFEYVRFS
jgi:benzoyl-CoA 2,3-dioxygenase component B